eukprot:scaffold2470_cov340-Prasinococcus_capsulatus_cf.AAC.2
MPVLRAGRTRCSAAVQASSSSPRARTPPRTISHSRGAAMMRARGRGWLALGTRRPSPQLLQGEGSTYPMEGGVPADMGGGIFGLAPRRRPDNRGPPGALQPGLPTASAAPPGASVWSHSANICQNGGGATPLAGAEAPSRAESGLFVGSSGTLAHAPRTVDLGSAARGATWLLSFCPKLSVVAALPAAPLVGGVGRASSGCVGAPRPRLPRPARAPVPGICRRPLLSSAARLLAL